MAGAPGHPACQRFSFSAFVAVIAFCPVGVKLPLIVIFTLSFPRRKDRPLPLSLTVTFFLPGAGQPTLPLASSSGFGLALRERCAPAGRKYQLIVSAPALSAVNEEEKLLLLSSAASFAALPPTFSCESRLA